MTSPSLLDRISRPRNQAPILPLHHDSRSFSKNAIQLDELDPHPEDDVLDPGPSGPRLRRPLLATDAPAAPSASTSWGRSHAASRSPSRGSRGSQTPIFAGPPPPIRSSILIDRRSSRHSTSPSQQRRPQGHVRLVDQISHDRPFRTARDSVWRGLQRREKALERDIQQSLDLQASGLISGSQGAPSEDFDRESEMGESTFYSAATSKSRMVQSLHVPARSTPDGNVIPVRQPPSRKPPGLQAARAGLRRSITALSGLKKEEGTHLAAALAERKDALARLEDLSARRQDIYAELHALEEDDEEPLGRELRELGAEHESLGEEIGLLEGKLAGMKNRRRWLRDKMDDVKNRREAGLSGYRAAGKEVDSEVHMILHRPPVAPLEDDFLSQAIDDNPDSTEEIIKGTELLQLHPERRTVEMAKAWWESEIAILEKRKNQVETEGAALDEGALVWAEVTALVTDFEAQLRGIIRGGHSSKGKKPEESQEDLIQGQLASMGTVAEVLEQKLQLAEERHWNLLICAIGAELEAFLEAKALLQHTFGVSPDAEQEQADTEPLSSEVPDGGEVDRSSQAHDAESDNEVPPELLFSHSEDRGHDEQVDSPPHSPIHGQAEEDSFDAR